MHSQHPAPSSVDIVRPQPRPLVCLPRLISHEPVNLKLVVPSTTEEPLNCCQVVVGHTASCTGRGAMGKQSERHSMNEYSTVKVNTSTIQHC